MVLAFVKVLIDAGHNPAETLWVQCVDVDRLAAMMCFIQLTLWHVPAQVIVGNTLTCEQREVWYTPAHHIGFWNTKLRKRWDTEEEPDHQPPAPQESEEPVEAPERPQPVYDEFQIDWHGQRLIVRHCAAWMGDETAHLEIISVDRTPHPISETGYRSHFIRPEHIAEEGGPVAYVTAWLRSLDDGKPKQLSLF